MQVIADYTLQTQLVQDFKLFKVNATELQEKSPNVTEVPKVNKNDEVDKEDENDEVEKEYENDDDEEEEFSFVCVNPDGSLISADDAFCNGQIRPMFPLFDQSILFSDEKSESCDSLRPPLKKLFVEEQASSSSSETDEAEGPFCSWSGKAIEASPEGCKKSYSTGFSKLWRFREFVLRSNSDGKDAFVFLNNTEKSTKMTDKSGKTTTVVVGETAVKKKGKSKETVSSVLERHYVKKEGEKRRSYLPYRQDIFGFFTNVNGLSRNVHPF